MLTVEEFAEDQVADCVTSCELPSLKIPYEMSCLLVPSTTEEFDGATDTDTRTAGDTLRASLPLIEVKPAMTVAEPAALAVTVPVGLTVATPTGPTDHIAELVTFCWVPSLKMAVALSCCRSPLASERPCGLTAIETKTAGETVSAPLPLSEAEEAVTVAEPIA